MNKTLVADMVDSIVAKMKAEIARHKLETLIHFPKDFALDREYLVEQVEPGAMFAWKIGHTGTHLIQLGLHQEKNRMVTYITRDSASDRFYKLVIMYKGYLITEVSAQQFEALQRTEIPYKQEGSNNSFWLTRNGIRLGHCSNSFVGDMYSSRYHTELSLKPGLSKTDSRALQLFGYYSCVQLAHSLFINQTVVETVLAAEKAA